MKRTKKRRARGVWARVRSYVTASNCILVLIAWLALELMLLPDVGPLARVDPQYSSLMRIRERQSGKPQTRIWVPLNRISPHLVRAVISMEDQGFFTHHGIALNEVSAAFMESARELKFPRGASTLTQQLAKNLYLHEWRTPRRKLREGLIALLLEFYLSKRRILELYLNFAEWGDGVFGAEAAAKAYYGKSAADLSVTQAARLAAMLPAPRSFQARKMQRILASRERIVLRRLSQVRLPADLFKEGGRSEETGTGAGLR